MKKPHRLLNLRNLGVNLRILIIVNLSLILAAVLLSASLSDFYGQLIRLSATAQPMLLFSLLLLYLSYPGLSKLSYGIGLIAVLGLTGLASSGGRAFLARVCAPDQVPSARRAVFVSNVRRGFML